MPTFPSSPLRFRTAGFPQYGSKAGVSTGPSRVARPSRHSVCILPSCPLQPSILLALCRSSWLCATPPFERFRRPTPGALAPVRVIVSRSIITYSAPSALLADTPQFPRIAAYMPRPRCAGCAGLGRPRAVPSFRCHSFSACRPQRPRRIRRLRAPSSSSATFAFVPCSIGLGTLNAPL